MISDSANAPELTDEQRLAMMDRMARELAEIDEHGPKCLCGHRFQEHGEKCASAACGCLRFRARE